jgi:hypothetical protein
MVFKLNRYHRDYLFGIYPLIILGLIIFAIKRDEHKRETTVLSNTNVNADSSITKSTQNVKVESPRLKKYNDSIPVFSAANK